MRLFKRKKPIPSPAYVVHLAAPQATFFHRSRQVCLWCGVLLEHKDWRRIPVPIVEGKTEDQVRAEMYNGTWGGWVAIDTETGQRFGVRPPPDGSPPANACAMEGVDEKTFAREHAAFLAEAEEAAAADSAPDEIPRREDRPAPPEAPEPGKRWARPGTDPATGEHHTLDTYESPKLDVDGLIAERKRRGLDPDDELP